MNDLEHSSSSSELPPFDRTHYHFLFTVYSNNVRRCY